MPGPGALAEADVSPAPSPTPDRSPTYQRGAPAGALRLPGEPPAVGDVIVEDPLTFPGAIPGSISCPTGLNLGEFVGEGYIMKVTGRCRPDSSMAMAMVPPIPDLVVPDGELRLEVKTVSGHDRAGLSILFRGRLDPFSLYHLDVHTGQGGAALSKEQGDAPPVYLAMREDLAGRLSRDDWNEYAIRLDGPKIWVLLNAEPILSASDSALDRGFVSFGVHRLGSLDDKAEVALVFGNLRVSRLAGGQ
jgi:hypothetical protein